MSHFLFHLYKQECFFLENRKVYNTLSPDPFDKSNEQKEAEMNSFLEQEKIQLKTNTNTQLLTLKHSFEKNSEKGEKISSQEAIQILTDLSENKGKNWNQGAKEFYRLYTLSLQKVLYDKNLYNGALNGVYDASTLAAVKTFQSQNNIRSTGNAGRITLNSLVSQNTFLKKSNKNHFTDDNPNRSDIVLPKAFYTTEKNTTPRQIWKIQGRGREGKERGRGEEKIAKNQDPNQENLLESVFDSISDVTQYVYSGISNVLEKERRDESDHTTAPIMNSLNTDRYSRNQTIFETQNTTPSPILPDRSPNLYDGTRRDKAEHKEGDREIEREIDTAAPINTQKKYNPQENEKKTETPPPIQIQKTQEILQNNIKQDIASAFTGNRNKERIGRVQEFLHKHGFAMKIDKSYGSSTHNAILDYAKKNPSISSPEIKNALKVRTEIREKIKKYSDPKNLKKQMRYTARVPSQRERKSIIQRLSQTSNWTLFFSKNNGKKGVIVDTHSHMAYLVSGTQDHPIFHKAYTVTLGKDGVGKGKNKTPTGLKKGIQREHNKKKINANLMYSDHGKRPFGSTLPLNQKDFASMTTEVIVFSSDGVALHGTNHEKTVGRNMSNGCVRFTNADIIDLVDTVYNPTIYIAESKTQPILNGNRETHLFKIQ